MKLLNTVALLLLLFASVARADHIGIYTDQGGASCLLSNPVPPPGVNSFYVMHKFSGFGTTGSQFKIVDGTGLTPFAQTSPFLPVGTWNVDLSIAYGECLWVASL